MGKELIAAGNGKEQMPVKEETKQERRGLKPKPVP